jgi:hypothetical protein
MSGSSSEKPLFNWKQTKHVLSYGEAEAFKKLFQESYPKLFKGHQKLIMKHQGLKGMIHPFPDHLPPDGKEVMAWIPLLNQFVKTRYDKIGDMWQLDGQYWFIQEELKVTDWID